MAHKIHSPPQRALFCLAVAILLRQPDGVALHAIHLVKKVQILFFQRTDTQVGQVSGIFRFEGEDTGQFLHFQ